MKVLFLNYEYPPLGGGAGRAMQSIVHQLTAMGFTIDIITSNTSFSYKESNECGVQIYAVPCLRKGIHDCGFRGALVYIFFAYFKLLELLHLNKYDIIHYFFSMPTGLISLLPGKHLSVPYVVSLRGSDVPKYDCYNKKVELLHFLLSPLTKLIWKRAKAVTAVTSSLKQIALQTKPDQVIDVIPNGVDTGIFVPLNDHKRNNKEFNLITVARLIERKGIQYILKAIAEIGNDSIKLTVIGEGNYENELRQLCNSLKLNDIVTFLGFRRRNTLPEYFSRSDAFILPSLAEAFGNVIAEAMACGLPIISTNEGGIPDLVDCDNGILVDPGNINQIKDAILKMKCNTKMRNHMSKANRSKIENKFRWDKVASAYINIYKRCLDGHYKRN